jgi:hypothetical protein
MMGSLAPHDGHTAVLGEPTEVSCVGFCGSASAEEQRFWVLSCMALKQGRRVFWGLMILPLSICRRSQ